MSKKIKTKKDKKNLKQKKTKPKIKTKTKTITDSKYCAPNKMKTKLKHKYCYDSKSLKKIATSWNKKYPKNKIEINSKSDDIYSLWVKIDEKLSKKCKNEWCWINKSYSKLDHVDFFRPLKPKLWKKKPREWLDSNNIYDVMVQYENKYPEFIFIGPVPIDFDLKGKKGKCIVDDLCKLKLKSLLKKKKTKLGIVFNLDKHTEDGSHWVALFCDIKNSKINYFDSYGIEPEDEIKLLINRFYDELLKINKKCTIEINTKRHQLKGSECGTYCLYFIVNMLDNISFGKFCNKKLSDDYIFSKRDDFFLKH